MHRKTKKHHYKFKNLTVLGMGILLAILLYQFEAFHRFLLSIGSLGYIGAFLGGILLVSSFTVAPGAVILLILVEKLNPWEIALLGGLGGVVGDFVIFKFVKDDLVQEVKPLFDKFGGKHLATLLHSKYFSWSLPVIGALLIASPLPDEIGVSIMGISKMPTWKFLLLSFVLDFIGVFAIVSASTFLKP